MSTSSIEQKNKYSFVSRSGNEFKTLFSITEAEFSAIKKANETIFWTYEFEEIYAIFITSVLDFDTTIFNIANKQAQHNFHISSEDHFSDSPVLQTRILSILTTYNLYENHIRSAMPRFYGRERGKTLVKEVLHDVEKSAEYKRGKILRDYYQHNRLPDLHHIFSQSAQYHGHKAVCFEVLTKKADLIAADNRKTIDENLFDSEDISVNKIIHDLVCVVKELHKVVNTKTSPDFEVAKSCLTNIKRQLALQQDASGSESPILLCEEDKEPHSYYIAFLNLEITERLRTRHSKDLLSNVFITNAPSSYTKTSGRILSDITERECSHGQSQKETVE